MGFDAVWFVEHHFLTSFSMSPCPEVIFGAVSGLTKRIQLGFGVVILPYHHAVRVAERVAMVDHMSGGRVEFGTGRSAPYEQTGMGLDPRDTRAMWEESLRMVPKIWEDGLFSWEGKYWNVPPRDVRPKPLQKPHPRIWVAALQPATYQLAAELGIGVMALTVAPPPYLAPHIQASNQPLRPPASGRGRRGRPRGRSLRRLRPDRLGAVEPDRRRHAGRARRPHRGRSGRLPAGHRHPRGGGRGRAAVPDGDGDRSARQGHVVHRDVRQVRHSGAEAKSSLTHARCVAASARRNRKPAPVA